MMTGFETIGNATLIGHDGGAPVLVTDPWLGGDAYFGSWTLRHKIPEEQLAAIARCPFVWLSHGHPDHLHGESLQTLKDRTILLPDHVGGRIRDGLTEEGYSVRVLEDRTWTPLSPRIRVQCIADYNQDAVLLVELNGRLVLNMNDAGERGWSRHVRKIVKEYPTSFLLKGSSMADMSNFFDEQGNFLPPKVGHAGTILGELADAYGVKFLIPFSANHFNQREDSNWAERYTTDYDAYAEGFEPAHCEMLPPFIRFDCDTDTLTEIAVESFDESAIVSPEAFGDRWSDPLEKGDFAAIDAYFRKIAHLYDYLDYINVRVGGEDHFVTLGERKRFHRGITFETPRGSLMTAIEYEIFDDLLIANFMKTSLHGDWPESQLYPDFAPYVAKYSDNGRAHSKSELARYRRAYRQRAPFEYLMHRAEMHSKNLFRKHLSRNTPLYKIARRVYRAFT